MPKKNSHITITDQFCGAGGSSQGARSAGEKFGSGVQIKMALNHWKLAIETHNTNFPDTDHDCTDISACDPRRYPSTDILITSPECTNHSLAKGVKIAQKQIDLYNTGVLDPAAERSRATMWDVCRFAEYHSYNAIIVENVVDARKWVLFDAWLTAMYALGYNHKCVYLNSMHCHPTPQSRDRMYIVFWKKGNKAPVLDYTPLAHCTRCGKDVNGIQTWKKTGVRHGKYKQQYVYCCPNDGSTVEPYYYAAFNCIDWSDIGTKIGDGKKPLAKNSIARISYGLKKYGAQPMQVINYSPGYVKRLSEPTSVMTTTDHHGLLTPFLVDDKQTTGINFRVRSATDPVNTIHTDPRVKMIMPFIIKGEHTTLTGYTKPVNEPVQTQTVRQSMSMVTPPLLTISRGKSLCRTVLDSTTTQSQMINNGVVTTEAWNSFIAQYYSTGHSTKHITEELGAVTTNDRSGLVTYTEPKIEDCYYRMLKPKEIKLAMAFGSDYTVLGSGKDQVKQLGNAVTPPAMEWLVKQVIESFN